MWTAFAKQRSNGQLGIHNRLTESSLRPVDHDQAEVSRAHVPDARRTTCDTSRDSKLLSINAVLRSGQAMPFDCHLATFRC